jgi:hypothetical protein
MNTQVCTVACGNTAVITSGNIDAVDHGDRYVLDAAVPGLVHHTLSEVVALVLLEPEPAIFLGAIGPHAKGNVDAFVQTRSKWSG